MFQNISCGWAAESRANALLGCSAQEGDEGGSDGRDRISSQFPRVSLQAVLPHLAPVSRGRFGHSPSLWEELVRIENCTLSKG